MAKKNEEPKKGAPSWMVTYGDMMSLLLCFFVILFSMSEIKQEKAMEVLRSVQYAFKMHTDIPRKNIVGTKLTIQEAIQNFQTNMNKAEAEKKSTSVRWPEAGDDTRVLFVREGLKVVIGGKSAFSKGKAEIPDLMKTRLMELSRLLKGFQYRIEIRGHASREPFGSEEVEKFGDVALEGDLESWSSGRWELSWQRAKNVARFLVEEGGIDRARVRPSAAADTEPMKLDFSDRMDYVGLLARNRRVEIIVTEEKVPLEHERSGITDGVNE